MIEDRNTQHIWLRCLKFLIRNRGRCHYGRCMPADCWKGAKILHVILQNRRFLATLPRTGTNYIISLLTCATDVENGLTGGYEYKDNLWIYDTQLPYSPSIQQFLRYQLLDYSCNANVFFHAHYPYKDKINSPPIVDIIDEEYLHSMHVIFTVRNIYEQIESFVMQRILEGEIKTQEEFIADGRVEGAIHYFNYWGDFAIDKKEGEDYLCIRYEDFVADPIKILANVSSIWNMDISTASFEEAVDLCSREKMIAKIPRNELEANTRISVRKDRGRILNERSLEYINKAIRNGLRHDFGYAFE
jgi:hypothetical protein